MALRKSEHHLGRRRRPKFVLIFLLPLKAVVSAVGAPNLFFIFLGVPKKNPSGSTEGGTPREQGKRRQRRLFRECINK